MYSSETSIPKCLPIAGFECTKTESPFFMWVTETKLPLDFTKRIVSASCAIIPPISSQTLDLINKIGIFSILHLPIVERLALPFELITSTSAPVSSSDRYFVVPSGDSV